VLAGVIQMLECLNHGLYKPCIQTGWTEQKSTAAKERWGGKMKNREDWRQIVQEAKAHPEL
jgi:hypothetical protein